MMIRFGYCPSNPGPNAKTGCRWYSDVHTAINNYDGKQSIWIKAGDGKYVKISYDELLSYLN